MLFRSPAEIKQDIADFRTKYEPLNTTAISFGVDVLPYKKRFETVENAWQAKANAIQRKKIAAVGFVLFFVFALAASGFVFKDKISKFIAGQAECSESKECAAYWKSTNNAFMSYKINHGKEQKEDRSNCISLIQSMTDEQCNCHKDSILSIKKQINYE